MAKRRSPDPPQERAVAIRQTSSDGDVRARVWELHLRCVPKSRIGQVVGLDRHTVGKIVAQGYREVGADRKEEQKRKLESAIVRMRRIAEQAWNDHDADDERERSVLALMLDAGMESDEEGNASKGRSMVRYQSQRSQYLRVMLDAEKEVARLEGLYEGLSEDVGAVVFKFVREGRPDPAGGATVTTAPYTAISDGGEDDE